MSKTVDAEQSEDHLRREKTRLEVEVLKRSLRPQLGQVPVILAFLAAVTALVGLTIQWRDARKDAEIAELRGAEAKRVAAEAQAQLQASRIAQAAITDSLRRTEDALAKADSALAAARRELTAVSHELAQKQLAVTGLQSVEAQLQARILSLEGNVEQLASTALAKSPDRAALDSAATQAIRDIYRDKVSRLSALERWPASALDSEDRRLHGETSEEAYDRKLSVLFGEIKDLEEHYPWLTRGETSE